MSLSSLSAHIAGDVFSYCKYWANRLTPVPPHVEHLVEWLWERMGRPLEHLDRRKDAY